MTNYSINTVKSYIAFPVHFSIISKAAYNENKICLPKVLAGLKFNFTFNNHHGMFTPCMLGNFFSKLMF